MKIVTNYIKKKNIATNQQADIVVPFVYTNFDLGLDTEFYRWYSCMRCECDSLNLNLFI